MINVLPNQAVKLNYSIIRGTTPTFNLKIPSSLDQSIISDVCVVFAQTKPLVALSLEDCTLQNQVLSFTLTQSQTYAFREGIPVLIQINVLATGGQVVASYIFSEEVKPNLCHSPFGSSIIGTQPNPNVVDNTNSGLNSSDQRILIDFGQIQNISGYVQAGEYDSETVYTAGQVVTYNGSSYVAKQTTVGNLPTDTDYWQLVAAKGDNGEDGFSPTVTVKTDTPTTYILTITDENGSYDTPNLKATIPNDYEEIKNKPKINSVELLGDLSYSDLKLLSSLLINYEAATLSGEDEGGYILAMDENGEKKIPVSDFLELVASTDTGKAVTIGDSGDVSQELLPDTFYNFTGDLTALTLTFAEQTAGRESEFKGQFVTGASVPTVSFPNEIAWVGGEFPELEAEKTYQFSVMNNVGVIVGV